MSKNRELNIFAVATRALRIITEKRPEIRLALAVEAISDLIAAAFTDTDETRTIEQTACEIAEKCLASDKLAPFD